MRCEVDKEEDLDLEEFDSEDEDWVDEDFNDKYEDEEAF